MIRGKFDPDVQEDAFLIYPDSIPYLTNNISKTVTLIYPANESIKIYQNLSNTSSKPTILTTGNGFLGALTVNIVGTSHDEIVKINSTGIIQNSETVNFDIYKTDPTSGIIFDREKQYFFNPGLSIFNSDTPIPTIIPKEFYTGNFTGTGVTEIMCIPKTNYFSNEIDILSLQSNIKKPIFSGVLFQKADNDLIFAIDIDGDGQTELLHVTSAKTDIYKYKLNPASGKKELLNIGQWPLSTTDFMSKISNGSFVNNTPGTISKVNGTLTQTADNQVFFADINGDGKIDIIKAPRRVSTHYKYKGVNVRSLKCIKCGALYGGFDDCPNGCPVCHDRYWTGSFNPWCIYNGKDHSHFNADGYNDYDYDTRIKSDGTCPVHGSWVDYDYDFYEEHADCTCYFTDGVNIPVKKTFTGPTCHGYSKIFIQDIDGDNVPELIVDGEIYAYRDKDHFFDATPFASTGISSDAEIIPFDLNSENKFTQLIALNSNGIEKVSFSEDRAENNQVSLMINSLGITDKTSYDKLYQGVSYTPGTQATFPDVDFIGPLWVTTQNSGLFNNQLISNSTYAYSGAILNKQGLGFRGFTSVASTDLFTNKVTTTVFDPYKMGAIISQTSDKESSTFDYTFIDYNLTATPQSLKMKLQLNSKTATDKIKGNTVTDTYSNYDDYGNAWLTKTEFSGTPVINSTVENTYNNIINDNVYLTGLLTNRKTTTNRDGKTFIQNDGYVYYDDTNKDRLHFIYKSIYKDAVTMLPISDTEYAYDPSYGMLTSETVHSVPTNDKLITTYGYDVDNCSLLTKTDPFGLKTKYVNDLTNRLLNKVTDYLGNTVTYGYDNWRRKNYELRPDGTTTNISWNWNTSDMTRLMYETQTSTGQPTSTSYSDAFGRETRKAVSGFDGTDVYADKNYDNFGHLESSSAPYKNGTTSLLTQYSYDDNDQLTTVAQPSGSTTDYTYSGNSVTENKDGVSTTKTTDATGKLVSTQDAGGTVSYTYRADGQPDNVNAAGVTTSFEYNDPYNRQTKLNDPSAGPVQTAYDDANHTVTQTWNSGKTIATVSNQFGQPVTKTTPDFVTTYTYDTTYGRPTGSTSTNGTSKALTYDGFGRLGEMDETVSGKTYHEVYSYDQGRINSITYNTNTGTNTLSYPVSYKYNTYGYLYRLEDASGNRLREVNSVNALGQETSVLMGNGLTTSKSYTPEGLWTNVKTFNTSTTWQNMSFDFNRQNGTLNSRTDNNRGLTENFSYGSLYRLEGYGMSANRQAVNYNTNGNILGKTDAGSYTYNSSEQPYNLSEIVTPAASGQGTQLDISYTVYSRPVAILNATYTAFFDYNDAYERASQQIRLGYYSHNNSDILSMKYYMGGGRYEVETAGNDEKQRLYLDGSPYTASVILEKIGTANPQLYYLHRDYLGSITQITDNSANLAAEYSYDAWGRMRNPANWSVYATASQPALLFSRGYTGHEHLNQFGLINMNARLYDPLLARFLAPDPFVNSSMANDFNRYVYCRNNPMMYIDLNGEWNFEVGWNSGTGFFYRYSNGNSGFNGNYNTNSSTFTAGSTYFGYQTGPMMYQSQYNPNNSLSNVLVGHYFTTFTAAWMADPNTIRVNLTSTLHNVYADYSFGLSNNGKSSEARINSEVDASGLGMSFVGLGVTASEIKMFNKINWFSLKQMKTYSQSFNGNGFTGGKIASAERISSTLNWTGRAIGVYNAYSINEQYISGELSNSQMAIEQGSNIYSTFGGIYGAAWSVGWELGRAITTLNSYQDFKQNTWIPWREQNLGY